MRLLFCLAILCVGHSTWADEAPVAQIVPREHNRALPSPDGRLVVTWCDRWGGRKAIAIWDAVSESVRQVIPLPVLDLDWCPGSTTGEPLRLLAVIEIGATSQRRCVALDPADGRITRVYVLPWDAAAHAVLCATDGATALIASSHPTQVRRLDLRRGALLELIAGSVPSPGVVYDLGAGRIVAGSIDPPSGTVIHADGQLRIPTSTGTRCIARDGSISDEPSGNDRIRMKTASVAPGAGIDLGWWSPASGSRLVMRDDGWWLISAGRHDRRLAVQTHAVDGSVPAMAVSSDGRLLAVAQDDRLDLFDPVAQRRRGSMTLPGWVMGMDALAFSIDGMHLAVVTIAKDRRGQKHTRHGADPDRMDMRLDVSDLSTGRRRHLALAGSTRFALGSRWLVIGTGNGPTQRLEWTVGSVSTAVDGSVERMPATFAHDAASGRWTCTANGRRLLIARCPMTYGLNQVLRRSDPDASDIALLGDGRWIVLATPAGIAVHQAPDTPPVALFPGTGPLITHPGDDRLLFAAAPTGGWRMLRVGDGTPRVEPVGWKEPVAWGRVRLVGDDRVAWIRDDGSVALADLADGIVRQVWWSRPGGWWLRDGEGGLLAWAGDIPWTTTPTIAPAALDTPETPRLGVEPDPSPR